MLVLNFHLNYLFMGSSFFDKTWKEFVSLGTHLILIRFYVQFLIIRSIR
jgi:hypothetical protein